MRIMKIKMTIEDEACWKAVAPVYGIDFEISAY